MRRPRAHSSGGAIPGDRCRWRRAWRWSPATAQDHDRHQNGRPLATRAGRRSVASLLRQDRAGRARGAPPRTRDVRTAGTSCGRQPDRGAETRRATPDPRLHTLRRIGRSMRRSNAQARAGLLGARDRWRHGQGCVPVARRSPHRSRYVRSPHLVRDDGTVFRANRSSPSGVPISDRTIKRIEETTMPPVGTLNISPHRSRRSRRVRRSHRGGGGCDHRAHGRRLARGGGQVEADRGADPVDVVSPGVRDTAGREGAGFVVDLALTARTKAANPLLSSESGYKPLFNNPTAPTFQPGANGPRPDSSCCCRRRPSRPAHHSKVRCQTLPASSRSTAWVSEGPHANAEHVADRQGRLWLRSPVLTAYLVTGTPPR